MDAESILDGLIRGALAGRGKRSRGTLGYLIGGKDSFLNASTLLTIAGVAWGVYDATKQKTTPSGPPVSAGAPSPPPPPLPQIDGSSVPDEVRRLVSLMISAARADGDLGLEERGQVLAHAREVGAEALVVPELQSPRPLAEIVAGVKDPRLKSEMYTLAFAIVKGDENVTGGERIYLAQLAHLLGLDAATVSRLEVDAAGRIGASG